MLPGSDSRKLQLWSDSRRKEFAVRLSDQHDFKAVSNPDAKYTKLVDEAEYFSDTKYDWKFLLEHWSGVINGSIRLVDNDGSKDPEPIPFDLVDALTPMKKPKRQRAQREKPKPLLKCRYCMPCPSGVDIPLNFELYNNTAVFKGNAVKLCRILYTSLPASQKASACKKCGICEEKCPQQIPISKMLEDVNRQFTEAEGANA